ncbi:MAG: tetratricopeptide repeat protein [Thiotrichales bacterium]
MASTSRARSRRIIVTAIMIGLVVVAGVLYLLRPSPGAAVARADESARAESIPSAKRLKQVLVTDPERADARYGLGIYALEAGEPISAERDLRQALALGWPPRLVLPALAKSLLAQGAYTKLLAEDVIGLALPAETQADLGALRAQALWALGRDADARMALDAARSVFPEALQVYMAETLALSRDGRFEEALKTVAAARVHHTGEADLDALAARIYIARGDHEFAVSQLTQIAESDQGQLSNRGRVARLWLAELHRREGQYDLADRQLVTVFARDPNDVAANFLSGAIAVERGDYPRAQQRLLRVVRQVPGHAPSLGYLTRIGIELGGFEQAAYFLERYVYRHPDDADASGRLARLHVLLGDLRSAHELLTEHRRDRESDARLLALVDHALGYVDAKQTLANAGKPGTVGSEVDCIVMAATLRLIANTNVTDAAVTETGSIRERIETCVNAPDVATAIAIGDWQAALAALSPSDDLEGPPAIVALVASLWSLAGDPARAERVDGALLKRLALEDLRGAGGDKPSHDVDAIARGMPNLVADAARFDRTRHGAVWNTVTQGFIASEAFDATSFQQTAFGSWGSIGVLFADLTQQGFGSKQSESSHGVSSEKPLIYRPEHAPRLPPAWAIALMILAVVIRWRVGRRERNSTSRG